MSAFFKDFRFACAIARRELRAGLSGFYIFLACLALGTAAIASVLSLSQGAIDSIRYDGRYILGGDIALRTVYAPATDEQVKWLRKNMGPTSIVMETRAMARRLDESNATLSELKAVDLFYPLYGTFTVTDEDGHEIPGHLQDFLVAPLGDDAALSGRWGALVEKELLPRLGLHIGDEIMVGDVKFRINGVIAKEPDRLGGNSFSLAPRVMISDEVFEKTGLNKTGSQVYYSHRILTPQYKTPLEIDGAEKAITEAFPKAQWKGRDCFNASPQTERMIKRLTLFLTFIGLATLLVGGVGASNAVRSFLDEKLPSIATLKCVGVNEKTVFTAYLLQILALALVGIALGAAAGAAVAQLGGIFLTERLSVTNRIGFYPQAIAVSAAYGLLTALAFSLWPLGAAIKTRPAALFRDRVASQGQRPNLGIIVAIVIVFELLALFAVLTTQDMRLALYFIAGAAVSFAAFQLYAVLLKGVLGHLRLRLKPEWRLAVQNLRRPGNATAGVILSLGLGLTVLIATALVERNVSTLMSPAGAKDAPSFFFLDVQAAQKDAFKKLLQAVPDIRNVQTTPSLRGRITAVNGRRAEEALADKSESWVISSDRGFTYAKDLPPYSHIVAGDWWPGDYQGPPAVSISSEVARAFNIGVGDKLTVNILGLDITATVKNVRDVDWASFTMNFAVTFAPGALEKAPATFIATAIVPEKAETKLQTDIAKSFPNITSVRVRDALTAASSIVASISQALRISALVTLLSGALVLSGAIAAARKRHVYDAVILKVIGASKARILKTFLLEYALLGSLTVLIAAVLGTAAAWGLTVHVMHLNFSFSPWPVLGVALLCLAITLLSGFAGTARALRQKPAPWLRNQ